MTGRDASVEIQCATRRAPGARRTREPITFGLPFPRGHVEDVRSLALTTADGDAVPLQAAVLDRWSDNSIRWALLDFQATCAGTQPAVYRLSINGREAVSPSALQVSADTAPASIQTGAAGFRLFEDGRLVATSRESAASVECRFRVIDRHGHANTIRNAQISCEVTGPLRSVLAMAGSIHSGNRPLELTVRYHFYAGLPIARVVATLRNPARAVHSGGYWDLGDPASQYIRDFSFLASPPSTPSRTTFCSAEPGLPMRRYGDSLLLCQDSSGGENWNSPNHRNRDGIVPVQFRGYRLQSDTSVLEGWRATPVVQLETSMVKLSIAQRRFWQRFPKAVSVADGGLRLGLLPEEFGDVHELQGGEQLTEDFVLSVGDEGIADIPLEWVRAPIYTSADPHWYCASDAVPHLTPVGDDPHLAHLSLINAAIDGDQTFERKRERLDEFGWRNFGDLYADHEGVFHQGPEPFVSHYNNQYDAIAGMAAQYFRSADVRWFDLLDDLARHVVDIDVYHTTKDKAAYNGGLFWHTAHHTNADRSTHRTYPRSGRASGGPAPEHNYNTGLMLYYFMSGDPQAREAALSLARWVIDMDDGEKTPLQWISRRRTGLASATGSLAYHGPGRGPGNSIVALLNAFRLTGDGSYMAKTDELIRRCSHPADDINSLNLLDAERRWFYTVFLQALGRYLGAKEEQNTLDEGYMYARAVLLHYASWMCEHEYPYLDKPEILEFPNETWAAQDMRKSEVFNYASRYAPAAERARLLERSRFFFDYSVSTLLRMPTRTLTRPLVLMLTNGNAQHWFQQQDSEPPAMPAADFGAPAHFIPQKTVALRRLRLIAIAILAAAVVVIGALALRR